MMSKAKVIPAISLNVLHIDFDPIKLFSYLYLSKFLDTLMR